MLQIDHEDANGQYELNFGFDEALASADHVMLFKLAAQALAEAHGSVFSMMPKPFQDQPGSGMHFHVSLWSDWNPKRPDNAHNVFVPHRKDGSADLDATLSPTGRHFIAGVMAHSRRTPPRWPRPPSTPTSGCVSMKPCPAPVGHRPT